MLCRTLRSARAPLQRTPDPPPLGVPRRAARAPLLPCACAPPCPTTRAPHAPRAAARAPRVPQHAARAPLVPLRVLPLRVLPKSRCALPLSRCPGAVPCSRVLSRRTRRLACVDWVGRLAVGDWRWCGRGSAAEVPSLVREGSSMPEFSVRRSLPNPPSSAARLSSCLCMRPPRCREPPAMRYVPFRVLPLMTP